MRSTARLLGHLETLLRDVAAAARKQDVPTVIRLLGNLQTLGSLIRRQEEIDRRQEEVDGTLAALKQGLAVPPVPGARMPDDTATDDGSETSSKERGRKHREDFVRTLGTLGIPVEKVKGQVFRTSHGLRVGIAYASESKRNKDGWFLGLPENDFDHAVLLCDGSNGKLTHFSLPSQFMDKHSRSLSRKNGQLKLNVRRRGEEFFLLVPPRASVSIDAFRDNFAGLTEGR